MKKIVTLLFVAIIFFSCKKDPVNTTPNPPKPEEPVSQLGLITTSTNFPLENESFTLAFDPAKGNAALFGYTGDIYIHAGVITQQSNNNPSNWRYVKFDWAVNNAAAKMVRQANGTYTIAITPRSFFNVPSGEAIQKIAMVFRSSDGSVVGRNKDGSDIFLPVYTANAMAVRFLQPEVEPLFTPKPIVSISAIGQELTVTGTASQAANLALYLNGVQFEAGSNITQLTGKVKITAGGVQTVKITANGAAAEAVISFVVAGTVQTAELPAGAKPGVTYINNGTSAIFALYAPNKQNVYLVGDFNNYTPDAAGFMKRTPDGNIWWTQIDGLNATTEYTYQYLVDGILKIADPYAEKVLDPANDASIPVINNANFGTYPTGKTSGIVSVAKLQTPYNWQALGFSRPAKNNLVIYELLLRDFLKNNNYQTLTDTLNYLSGLGVNAVELMPVTEFEGNLSWGYNPSFYFAPDKYYGSKAGLQRFIDECHKRGIAVILDMVLNHSFGQSPMVQLYFDQTTQKPAANNPWFNVDAMHPYNVGYDFNHASVATKTFVKEVLKFWMQEYKVDGFRFDLSKGFTQTNYGTGDNAVGAWSSYDAGRVAIWKDYNNYIKSTDANNFYVILEHFAADAEEKELATDGMMFWNNLNYNFNEAIMGWLSNSNFQRGIYTTHGFTQPDYLVSYMESHDEERIMFKNISYGNTTGAQNAKEANNALKRTEMGAAFLFAMPGPKMFWQFGELGYDVSIEQNGRTGEKPLHWEYNTQPARITLKNAFAKFINLKKKNTVYQTTNITYDFSGAVKYIKLQDAANTVIVVGNFDVNNQAASVNFGAAGVWYDAANANATVTLAGNTYAQTLAPGEYHIFSKNMLVQ